MKGVKRMSTRISPYAGWAAYLSGLFAILSAVFLILFFGLEAPNLARSVVQEFHIWGPLSDICPIIQMVTLLVVAWVLYRMEWTGAPGLSLIVYVIGIAGMLGVSLLQLLLIMDVISFEQEVGPVVMATGVVGIWLILVNQLGRRQASLPSRLAWLGTVVGAAFMFEPVIFSALGGAVGWRNITSNYLLLAGSALVFLISYIGFPVWAIWLGRVFTANRRESTLRPNAARAQVG